MPDKDKPDEIKVEDRRYFDREGNPVSASDEPTEAEAAPAPSPPSMESALEPEPKLDFVSLLFSFVHTALVHLGEVEDPIQRKVSENLTGARQMIDTLELLQEKTKGNLTKEEEEYLEAALFDLRMRFMQKAKILK